MYAIIEDSGTQISVTEGDVVKVAIRDLPDDVSTVSFDKVLLVAPTPPPPDGAEDKKSSGGAKIGAPYIEGAKVTADVLVQERTKRVPVVKFKKRKTYLRRKSHRQDYLKVKITSIKG